ncbi:MAG: sugar ABC transporter permease [SAR324 cluster bacterium]|nr:sugar ABC transporter permease [SAR324 cluster bacterium]
MELRRSDIILSRLAAGPSILLLFVWMAVPLAMTIYFSFLNYNLLEPGMEQWTGFLNYEFFFSDPAFGQALFNTLAMVGMIIVFSVVLGLLTAVLLNQDFWGRGLTRVLAISPFFIMPTVSALLWKNMLMHPVSGFFAWLFSAVNLEPIDWLSDFPLGSIIMMITWQWIPFAALILLTSLQSLDESQVEAAKIDGAGPIRMFLYITVPHLMRSVVVVVLIESIFLLTIFAEIFVTTGGGPGLETTNIAFLVYSQALLQFDVGGAAAGGVVAVILANIVAIFLMRMIGKNLD